MIDKQTNTRLKRFAQEARRYLIDQVNTKLSEVLAPDSDASTYEKTKPLYNALLAEIKKTCPHLTSETYDLKPIAERVAYTWFNRFTALRYMDCKHFSPAKIISPKGSDSLPQILADAKMGIIDATLIGSDDRQRVLGLLSGTQESTYHKGDVQSEAYRILLLGACNHFGRNLPFLFKQIKDWMELLLPDDLLGEHGILAMIREVMTEDACEDVEVIGWLYQYYISEKKDEVFANVKIGKKVQSAEIPAVTQLFTPHWIVKYMVQNSLGMLWLHNHPNSTLKAQMEYYIGVETSDLQQADAEIGIIIKSPEEIKFCDPCCGSGHILTYAFDLLYEIYSEEGYDPIDIPRLIISKNLYGIEIDERASELAAFALAMKARDKDKSWFSRGLDPNICLLENISFGGDEIDPYMDRCGRDVFTLNFERMLSQFEHTDTFGSLIVPYEQDIEAISETLNAKDFRSDVFLAPTHKKVLNLLKQADYLSTKYQVVVTNPPYLGTSGFGKEKETWFRTHYPNSRSDFFAMFMERCLSLSVSKGFMAMINMQSWMFLSTYEKLRKDLVSKYEFISMAHLGSRAFDSIGGEVVSTTSFVIQNKAPGSKRGAYFRLLDAKSEDEKSNLYLQAITNPYCGYFYLIASSEFKKIPGAPIAYWVSETIRKAFMQYKLIGDCVPVRVGMHTGSNELFIRLWHEVDFNNTGFNCAKEQDTSTMPYKWYPYNKGGSFRKWYGNREYVVNWKNKGKDIHDFHGIPITHNGAPVRAKLLQFKESITWSFVASTVFGVRYSPEGSMFDVGGSSLFPKHTDISKYVGFLCSKVCVEFLKVVNPTLNFQVGNVSSLPIVDNPIVKITTDSCIELSSKDWDSYETSWDFKQLPLIQWEGYRWQVTVKEVYAKLRDQWIESTLRMQELEEENNRIFIKAYGLQDELSPEVPLREITLTCNPYYRYGVSAEPPSQNAKSNPDTSGVNPSSDPGITRESRGNHEGNEEASSRRFPLNPDLEQRLLADTMKELISYAVGCMFGRYSLDKPGLILANQGESFEDFLNLVPEPIFIPDKDNVIPILDGEWFIDDIVSRFNEFLKVAFGAEKYSENISFIEEALGKDLRAYFLKDFNNDHVKRYKKRPIYWLFSSPNGSFNALIYMHRYTPDTVSILLNGYLREYIHKLRAKVSQLEHQLNASGHSERDKMITRKEIDRLKEVISELELWDAKVLLPLAEKRIEIDLDDGVKVNYVKFSGAVRNIPGLAAKDE